MLEKMDISLHLKGKESVDVGGESDRNARPLDFDWEHRGGNFDGIWPNLSLKLGYFGDKYELEHPLNRSGFG